MSDSKVSYDDDYLMLINGFVKESISITSFSDALFELLYLYYYDKNQLLFNITFNNKESGWIKKKIEISQAKYKVQLKVNDSSFELYFVAGKFVTKYKEKIFMKHPTFTLDGMYADIIMQIAVDNDDNFLEIYYQAKSNLGTQGAARFKFPMQKDHLEEMLNEEFIVIVNSDSEFKDKGQQGCIIVRHNN